MVNWLTIKTFIIAYFFDISGQEFGMINYQTDHYSLGLDGCLMFRNGVIICILILNIYCLNQLARCVINLRHHRSGVQHANTRISKHVVVGINPISLSLSRCKMPGIYHKLSCTLSGGNTVLSFHPTGSIQSPQSATRIPTSLVLTLHHKIWYDEPFITHNCITARRAGAHAMVYTKKVTSKYCSVWECRLFIPANCPPPNNKPGARNHCEKLFFV